MKKVFYYGLIIVAVVVGLYLYLNTDKYAVANTNTPVFYTADMNAVFGNGTLEDATNLPWFEDYGEGNRLHIDPWGEIDELEFVAFPKTAFDIVKKIRRDGYVMYQVTTEEYPYCAESEKGCFVDSRFVTVVEEKPESRDAEMPAAETILQNLRAAEGVDYVWGGNAINGIPELLTFYPPADEDIPQRLEEQWILKGVDCSGLLYEATNGMTPRNTSELVAYGEAVEIADLETAEIAAKLQPLDLIVWKGHNLIVLDGNTVIESINDFRADTDAIEGGGVRIVNLEERLAEIMEDHLPVDNYDDEVPEDMKKFVVRRWHGESQL